MPFAELFSCSACNLYTSYIPKLPEPELQKYFCMHCGRPTQIMNRRFIHIDSDAQVMAARDHDHGHTYAPRRDPGRSLLHSAAETLRRARNALLRPARPLSPATVAGRYVLCVAATTAALVLLIVARKAK